MKNTKIIPLVEKELKSYTSSAIAYTLAIFFIFIANLWFFQIDNFLLKERIDFREYFSVFSVLFVILIPAITMRSFSEEIRQGTLEIITTLPLKEWHIVVSKFLAALITVLAIVTIGLLTPFSLWGLGYFDIGVLLSQYFGVILLAALQIAIGQYISSLSENQVTSFLISAAILLFINSIGLSQSLVPSSFFSFISWFSVSYHFNSFSKGIIDTKDLAYFICLTFLFLYLNKSNLLFRKWR